MKTTVLISFFFLIFLAQIAKSQDKFITKTGYISFLSETLLENIFAETNEAGSIIDLKTGEIVFSLPIKSFHFKVKLMEEHFNENYLESEKFPKALFSGKIEGIDKFSFETTSPQVFTVKGDMTIHGVKKPVTATATLTAVSKSKIVGEANFKIKPGEHDIKIPSAVGMKIAEEVGVKVKADYSPFNN